MRKRTKITIDSKYVFIAIITLCIVLIIVSFKFQDKMMPVRSAAGTVVTPMQKGINLIGTKISNKCDYITTVKKAVDKSKRLQKKIDELSATNKLLQQDKYELNNFRELYKLDKQYSSYPKVAARVISSDPENWYNEFIIDKGTKDGLKKNMNVMAGDGLVGIIVEVHKSYSRVRSIIDDKSNVSGTILKTSDGCMINGNLKLMDDGVIEVSGISASAKIDDGAEVVTSQISDRYLPGILIGYIKDLKKDSSNITQKGYLSPVVNFKGLNMVLVITQVKDTGDLQEMLK